MRRISNYSLLSLPLLMIFNALNNGFDFIMWHLWVLRRDIQEHPIQVLNVDLNIVSTLIAVILPQSVRLASLTVGAAVILRGEGFPE
jgi:hypothetical protein